MKTQSLGRFMKTLQLCAGDQRRESGCGKGAAQLLLLLVLTVGSGQSLSATVTAVFVQSPNLSLNNTTDVTSPIHFEATAESDLNVTGYVVYFDNQNVYQNYLPSLNTWVILPPSGTHSIYIKAWDSSGSFLSTSAYSVNLIGVAPPIPPAIATRLADIEKPAKFSWEVDNDPGVGGQCNDGSIGTWASNSDPNTANAPKSDGNGQHFLVKSKCTYDDSLFFWKDSQNPQPSHTNFLWDFWIYIPTSTQNGYVQALEFDLFQAVRMSDGVHEFMFGSQCNYATNQWQFWLPENGDLQWVNSGLSPCQFSSGQWHHANYFVQRVTATGYQVIPAKFSPSSDTNTDLRFGTLTIDGNTMYMGGLAHSTNPAKPKWSPVLGIQHQLDSAESGVTIDEFVDEESVTSW